MSPSPSTAPFHLSVTAGPATELFVVDSQLNLVARAIGRLEETLPADIYKVRSRTGRTETEQILVLNRDVRLDLPWNPEFSSPVPLSSTSTAGALQATAASIVSGDIRVHAGTGAGVSLVARWWTGDAMPSTRQSPAAGISLFTWDGDLVIDLEAQGVSHDGTGDPLVGCAAEVDPGTYVLRRPAPTGSTIEQTVIASPGWQTQVFLLKRPPSRSPDPDPETHALDEVSILISRTGFQPDAEDMRLAELARIALADERRILSDDLNMMAAAKFDNPMLGILAGHLLDLTLRRGEQDEKAARKAVRTKAPGPVLLKNDLTSRGLDVIVGNLRRLLGSEHPDVEALSLKCQNPALRTKRPLAVAPMLRRSWSLYVEASNTNPRLVPIGLWDRVASTTTAAPFLAWQTRDASTADDPARAVAQALVGRSGEGLAASVVATPIATRDQAGTAVRPRILRSGGGPVMGMLPTDSTIGDIANMEAPEVQPETVTLRAKQKLSPTAKKSISVDHDIPRAALDRALRGL